MVQQVIYTGAAPNDSTGDNLRLAFTKVNANFSEIYGNVWTGTIQLIGNTITTNTSAGNLNLSPNASVIIAGTAPAHVINTTDSTSPDTGGLVLSGGLGVAKSLYTGGGITALGGINNTIIGSADYSKSTTGYFTNTFNSGNLYVGTYSNLATINAGYTSTSVLNVGTLATINYAIIGIASIGTLANVGGISINSLNNTPVGNSIPSFGGFTNVFVTGNTTTQYLMANVNSYVTANSFTGNLIANTAIYSPAFYYANGTAFIGGGGGGLNIMDGGGASTTYDITDKVIDGGAAV
jgi:hypothetical protein